MATTFAFVITLNFNAKRCVLIRSNNDLPTRKLRLIALVTSLRRSCSFKCLLFFVQLLLLDPLLLRAIHCACSWRNDAFGPVCRNVFNAALS